MVKGMGVRAFREGCVCLLRMFCKGAGVGVGGAKLPTPPFHSPTLYTAYSPPSSHQPCLRPTLTLYQSTQSADLTQGHNLGNRIC